MSVVSDLPVEPLRELYIVANTPMFIYRRFRRLPILQQLAERHSAADLVAAYNEHGGAPNRSVDDIVRAYAALVALSYAEYRSAREAAKDLRPGLLTWTDHILDAVFALNRPLSTTLLVIAPRLAGPTSSPSATTSNVLVHSQPSVAPNVAPAAAPAAQSLIILGERR